MAQDYNISLNVLGYREDDVWVALALEMDLRGYGETFADALAELKEVVEMQIGFAHFKGQPEMIFRAADPIWVERFAEVRRTRVVEMLTSHPANRENYEAAGLPIPPAHIIAAMRNNFTKANA
jgi:predicted RNase H-like HicB family nuclease